MLTCAVQRPPILSLMRDCEDISEKPIENEALSPFGSMFRIVPGILTVWPLQSESTDASHTPIQLLHLPPGMGH